jgi:chromosome segregation ATPase
MKDIDSTLPENLKNVVEFISSALAKSSVKESGKHQKGLAGTEDDKTAASTDSGRKTKREENRVMENDTELEQQVRATVESLLGEKNAQEKVEATIKKLELDKGDAIDRATAAEAEVANLSTDIEAQVTEIMEAKAAIDTLNKEKEEQTATIAEMKQKLDTIEAEKTLAERTATLTEAKILLPEGEVRDAQVTRVAAMEAEAFDAYVLELTAVRSAKTTEDGKEGGTDKTEASLKTDSVDTPDVTSATTFAQVLASAGEVKTDPSRVDLYASM